MTPAPSRDVEVSNAVVTPVRSSIAMPHAPEPVASTPAARSGAPDPVRPLALAVIGGAVILGVVVCGVLALAGLLVVGLVAGIVLAGAAGAGAWFGAVRPRVRDADQRVLALVGPHRAVDPAVGEPGEARLANLVEGLAPGAGVARPACFLVDDAAPNALAAGRDARSGCIVATTGLLDLLSRMELEGVVAQCLVRIRDGDVAAPTIALALGRRGNGPAPETDGRSFPADRAAVALTRYPPGLASALRHLASDPGAVPAAASELLGPLWLVPPGSSVALQQRIAALEEL